MHVLLADADESTRLLIGEVLASLGHEVEGVADGEAAWAAWQRDRPPLVLARARWLAGIGETTLAIQHELNNPLAALLGNAALIEARIIRPDEYEETVGIITEQAKRIAAVVKRLASLRDPKSVEYLRGARMLDLSPDGDPETRGA